MKGTRDQGPGTRDGGWGDQRTGVARGKSPATASRGRITRLQDGGRFDAPLSLDDDLRSHRENTVHVVEVALAEDDRSPPVGPANLA